MPNAEAYDPFAELEKEKTDYSRPQPVSNLQVGILYKVVKFTQMQSKFRDGDGSFPMNTVARYYEGGLKFQNIMPKKFNNKTKQWMDAMNKLIDNKVGPNIVYYDTLTGHEVDILRHTQAVDQEKLKTISRLMEKAKEGNGGATADSSKRQSLTDTETGPSKKPRME